MNSFYTAKGTTLTELWKKERNEVIFYPFDLTQQQQQQQQQQQKLEKKFTQPYNPSLS